MVPEYTIRIHRDGRIGTFGARFFLRRAGPPTSVNERPSPTLLRLPLPRTSGPGDRAT